MKLLEYIWLGFTSLLKVNSIDLTFHQYKIIKGFIGTKQRESLRLFHRKPPTWQRGGSAAYKHLCGARQHLWAEPLCGVMRSSLCPSSVCEGGINVVFVQAGSSTGRDRHAECQEYFNLSASRWESRHTVTTVCLQERLSSSGSFCSLRSCVVVSSCGVKAE